MDPAAMEMVVDDLQRAHDLLQRQRLTEGEKAFAKRLLKDAMGELNRHILQMEGY